MAGKIMPNLIEVRQGDSFAIYINAKNCCKSVDLTGASLLMQVRRKDNRSLVFAVEGVGVDRANGKMALMLTPNETNADVGDYICDIQLTLSTGEVHTVYPSDVNKIATFRITEQVTEV